MRLYEVSKPKFSPEQPLEEPYSNIAEFILANCKPWLNTVGLENMVFRGIKTHTPFFIQDVLQARKPKDTAPHMHKLFNNLIKLAGGIANRSNSAFVSGSTNMTWNYGYGKAHVAFPIGNFNYTWSPDWIDWYRELTPNPLKLINLMYVPIGDNLTQQYISMKDTHPELMKLANYDVRRVKQQIHCDLGQADLLQAIDTEHEIMIKCDKILYIEKERWVNAIKPYVEARIHQ